MDTPQTQQPSKPDDVQTEQSITPASSKPKSTTYVWITIVLVLLVVAGFGAYFFGTGALSPTALAPTPTATPTPTLMASESPTPSAGPSATPAPSATATLSPKPTIAPNPDGNTFTSGKNGVAFYYADKTPADSTGAVKTSETGNTVYVYISSGKPEAGQRIERFDKSPTDTLAQAIIKRFLSGVSSNDCFIRIDPKKPSPTITKATIGYPVPENAQPPYFEYGQKCPEKYKESNGIAYFFEDSTSPDRFYYVSIGQYGIPAYNSKDNPLWQDTIVVF